MTDEAALKLAEAINRLAAAIESVKGSGMTGGIQVHHTGLPSYQPSVFSPYWQNPQGPNGMTGSRY